MVEQYSVVELVGKGRVVMARQWYVEQYVEQWCGSRGRVAASGRALVVSSGGRAVVVSSGSQW